MILGISDGTRDDDVLRAWREEIMFASGPIGSVWICLGGLNGLGTALDLGGFVGATEFAKSLSFGVRSRTR